MSSFEGPNQHPELISHRQTSVHFFSCVNPHLIRKTICSLFQTIFFDLFPSNCEGSKITENRTSTYFKLNEGLIRGRTARLPLGNSLNSFPGFLMVSRFELNTSFGATQAPTNPCDGEEKYLWRGLTVVHQRVINWRKYKYVRRAAAEDIHPKIPSKFIPTQLLQTSPITRYKVVNSLPGLISMVSPLTYASFSTSVVTISTALLNFAFCSSVGWVELVPPPQPSGAPFIHCNSSLPQAMLVSRP